MTTTSPRLQRKRSVSCVERPSEELWDLVVVHTIHPGQDCSWLASQAAVLDTTYRLEGIEGLHRL